MKKPGDPVVFIHQPTGAREIRAGIKTRDFPPPWTDIIGVRMPDGHETVVHNSNVFDQCAGCDQPQLTRAYRARFEGGDWEIVYYCDDCASAARGEFEGAPWCGETADAIELCEDGAE